MTEIPDSKKQMRNEAMRVHESAMYPAQTQLEYSKTWRSIDRWLGGFAALAAAIAGAGGLSEVIPPKWAGLIALVAAGTGAMATFLGAPKSKTQAHASGNAFLALQQDARIFINIDLDRLSADEARDRLSELVARHQELKNTSEIPSGRAWKKGKKNVEKGGQTYDIDTEIDR